MNPLVSADPTVMAYTRVATTPLSMATNMENLAVWVAALRSGRFQQGQQFLATIKPDGTKRYCCLGVGMEKLGATVVHTFGLGGANVCSFGPGVYKMPDKRFADWLGVEWGATRNPEGQPAWYIPVPRGQLEVAAFNDGSGTFDQIADLVEQYGIGIRKESW